MKANQKSISKSDEAVSPVIATILMVAITVVLAASVYVWVSGFSSRSSAPASSITVSGTTPSYTCGELSCKNFTVASSGAGLKYAQLRFLVDNQVYLLDPSCTPTTTNRIGACAGTTVLDGADDVKAGDLLRFATTSAVSGKQLQIIDTNANTVLVTMTIY